MSLVQVASCELSRRQNAVGEWDFLSLHGLSLPDTFKLAYIRRTLYLRHGSQVPYDSLRRNVRDRKHIVEGIRSAVLSLEASASNKLSNEERLQDIDKLISKLKRMKRKVGILY